MAHIHLNIPTSPQHVAYILHAPILAHNISKSTNQFLTNIKYLITHDKIFALSVLTYANLADKLFPIKITLE